MSLFSEMMDDGSGAHMEAGADSAVLRIRTRDQTIESVDAMVETHTNAEEVDPQTMEVTRMEKKRVHIPRSVFDENELGYPNRNMQVDEMDGQEVIRTWAVDLNQTAYSTSWVSLGLMREPLISRNEMRGSDV